MFGDDFIRREERGITHKDDAGFLIRKIENYETKNRFRNKPYIMPSGKIVYVQGNEDMALDLLIHKYKESDIIVGDKEIERYVGKITYIGIDGKIHRYFPDIYVVSERKIFEVKSEFTYKLQEKTNILKRKAVEDAGFRFEFLIF